jgi:hypothetical protein
MGFVKTSKGIITHNLRPFNIDAGAQFIMPVPLLSIANLFSYGVVVPIETCLKSSFQCHCEEAPLGLTKQSEHIRYIGPYLYREVQIVSLTFPCGQDPDPDRWVSSSQNPTPLVGQ